MADREQDSRSPALIAAQILLLAVLYFSTGKLGLLLAVPPGFATVIWPPSGIALGALLISGRALWPGIFLGSFALNSVIGGAYDTNMGFTYDRLAVAAIIAAGSTVQALAARWLIRRIVGTPIDLVSLPDIVKLFVFSGPVPCLIASTVGVSTLFASGAIPADTVLSNWWTWWSGDVLGVAVFLPLVLVTPWGRHRLHWRGSPVGGLPSAAIVAILVPIGLTFYAWKANSESIHEKNKAVFATLTDESELALFHRLDSYTQALFGGLGYFKGSNRVTSEEWRKYTESIKLTTNFPGINGIGYIHKTSEKDLTAFLATARADQPSFKVHPQTKDRPYYIIQHIEPIEINKEARGLNIGFEDNRVQAAERSRDTGEPAITKRILLVQDQTKSPGFLLLLPLFRDGVPIDTVASRRSALLGWIYAPFIARSFLQGLTAAQGETIDLRIFDGDEESPRTLIYDSRSDDRKKASPAFVVRKHVEVMQQRWVLVWSSTATFETNVQSSEPALILSGGLVFATFFTILLFLLARRSDVVQTMVREKTRELAERESLYRLLAENSSDMISRIGLDGTQFYVSPACEDLLGYTAEEMKQKQFLDDFHPDDYLKLGKYIRAFARGEMDHASAVFAMRRKGGIWIQAEVLVQLVRDVESGAPLETVVTTRDVTLREQRAEELQQAKEEADLAKARAEEANEAKTAFLASMSHEIRTPLNAIIGYTNIILESCSDLDATTRRQILLIRNAGSALLSIVNDILDFSRIEAGEIKLDPRPFSLNEVIAKTSSIVQPLFDEKKLSFHIVKNNTGNWYVGDEGRISQILLNLLNNACKFTTEGSVNLTVNVTPENSHTDHIRIDVADTGPGIPGDKMFRLFKRFSQIDASVHRRFGGSGLGLAISKQLVDLMDGHIDVDSVEGHGATFWFELNLSKCTAQAETVSEMAPVDFPKGLRILLAEDLEINQDIAVASLASGEPEVDVVANGMEAVQAAAERDYDIILMDIQMPGMDGIAATKEIRKLPGRKGHVPVIAMTANVLPHQIERIRNAGLNDHVGKPFDKRELFRIIARWALEPAVVDVEGQCTDEGEVAPNHSQYEPDNELEVLQLDVLQDFIRTLGESKTKRSVLSLRELVETIEAFAELPEKPNDQILQTAHKIVSTAGLLGFLHLSQVARDLQDACRSGANIDEALQKFGKIGSLSKIRMRDLEDDVGFRT